MLPEPMPRNWLIRRFHSDLEWPLSAHLPDYHEAGHFVAARALSMPAHSARVYSETQGVFLMFEPSEPMDVAPTPCAIDSQTVALWLQVGKKSWPGLSDADIGLRLAAQLYAGHQAELLSAGEPLTRGRALLLSGSTDHQLAGQILRAAGEPEAKGYAQRLARHVLSLHWDKVEKIAAELRATGRYEPSASSLLHDQLPTVHLTPHEEQHHV